MLDGPHFEVVAGLSVVKAIRAERARSVQLTPAGYASDSLCRHQESLAGRGILGAEIVNSMYGWSVRYDSGLQGWGIIAGARRRDIDGSFEAAVEYARRWCEQDPTRRYAWTRRAA